MRKLLNLLISRPTFARAMFALFVSGLGTAFTSVAVYQQLSKMNWGPMGFALAFTAGLLPGMIASSFSGRHSSKWPIGKMLVIGQLIGLTALGGAIWGSLYNQVAWLLLAEVATSAIGGLLLPVYKGLERASFVEEEFPLLASLDTFLLTANFIVGQGIGALLISHFPLTEFLLFNVTSYLAALLLLLPLAKSLGPLSAENPQESGSETRLSLRSLSPEQKRALMLLIWLPLVTAPLMVILPARGAEFGDSAKLIGFVSITPALFLICGRTLGQILGPLASYVLDMNRLSQRQWTMSVALFAYIIAYALAFVVPSLYLAVALCVIAHLFSNIVYSVGNFQLLKAFSPQEIGWAAGFVYRAATLVISLVGLLAGVMATHLGWSSVVSVSVLTWLVGGIFWRSNVTSS